MVEEVVQVEKDRIVYGKTSAGVITPIQVDDNGKVQVGWTY